MRGDDPCGRQPAARPDPDQSHIIGEVIINRMSGYRFDEVDLGGPFAMKLAVEEINHDLPRKPIGRRLPLPSSLKICAQVRIKASFAELWMMVPEPKPTEPWASTRIRTTVSQGLGFWKAGSACDSSSCSGRASGPSRLRASWPRAIGNVLPRPRRPSSSPSAWAREFAGGWALALAFR